MSSFPHFDALFSNALLDGGGYREAVLCEGIWCRIRVTEGEARDEPLMSWGGDNQGEGRRKRGIGNWELHRFWGEGIEGWYCCGSVEYGFVSLEVLDLLVTKRRTQCSSSLETCKHGGFSLFAFPDSP